MKPQQVKPGASPIFSQALLQEQWESHKMDPWLRAVIITATLLYYQYGASRCRITRLLGNTEDELGDRGTAHYYGRAADLSVVDLCPRRSSVTRAEILARRWPNALAVVDRLNLLFPREGGGVQTATYEGDHIHVEVPSGGFRGDSYALACWPEAGAVSPRVHRGEQWNGISGVA